MINLWFCSVWWTTMISIDSNQPFPCEYNNKGYSKVFLSSSSSPSSSSSLSLSLSSNDHKRMRMRIRGINCANSKLISESFNCPSSYHLINWIVNILLKVIICFILIPIIILPSTSSSLAQSKRLFPGN